MDVWIPVAVWGALKLAAVLIDWHGRLRYERARAASVAAMLEKLPAGGAVLDQRADGTILSIEAPPGSGCQSLVAPLLRLPGG